MSEKPRIAFFDFTCCEGCQLQVANLGERLLTLLGLVDLAEFRELLSSRWPGRLQLAVVEGSITTPEAAARLEQIRARSDKLLAIGACATCGGVNGLAKRLPGVGHAVRAVPQVVPVDYLVPGCPIHPDEFVAVLQAALAGLPYPLPDVAVCTECKRNENVCVYDYGCTCLGPITRAGCDAWCLNHGNICYGCRGPVSNPNKSGAELVFERYGLSAAALQQQCDLYGSALEEDE